MWGLKNSRFSALLLVAAIAVCARGDELDTLHMWPENELTFARLIYRDAGYRVGRGDAGTDYPEAEFYYTLGVSRLSRIDMQRPVMNNTGVFIRLEDDSLFNYPWLYAVEVGNWYLDDYDAGRLREYLLRGGFLMVDDFHGQSEWISFLDSMTRVFPNRPILDIEDSNELLHVVYDVDERIQVPGIYPLSMGVTYENGGIEPHWRGIYDDNGRLMVIINHNMDLGDSWEEADTPGYPQEMTTLGLHFAVNYAVYAMTH